MLRIYTLNDVGNNDGSKLESLPSNRYSPSHLELEEQLKKDREMFTRSARQLITKYHTLDKKNKCMQNDLDHLHEENERKQNDLDYLHEENERMQNSMKQIAPLAMRQNDLINKLSSKITCERKSHADLNTKRLKEITSLKARINELEAELEQTAQKALLAKGAREEDPDTIQSLDIRMKELKNELEQVTQDLSFKDGLIFCLRSRVTEVIWKMNVIA